MLNDFEAVGYGIPALEPDDVVPPTKHKPKAKVGRGPRGGALALPQQPRAVFAGDRGAVPPTWVQSGSLEPDPCGGGFGTTGAQRCLDVATALQAPKVVMGPGTGLGAAQLMWDDGLQDYKVWPGQSVPPFFPSLMAPAAQRLRW